MIALFTPAKRLVSLGMELKTGEFGYIIVRNRRSRIAVVDHFSAKTDGIYRTHSLVLEDENDFAVVFAIVVTEPVSAFNRLEKLVFHREARTYEDILDIASDDGGQNVVVTRYTECALLTGYRNIDDKNIIKKK